MKYAVLSNLEIGPLMRVSLIRLGDQEHILLAILHHIIADGWSAGIFIAEMVPLYEAFVSGGTSPLPELKVQYADFSAWQHGWLQGPLLERQISYWGNQLKGPLPVLDLAGDFPRPESPRGYGSMVAISVPQGLVQKLRLLGNREGCTLFMTPAERVLCPSPCPEPAGRSDRRNRFSQSQFH